MSGVFIEYECEGWRGIVGPFSDRAAADRWASDQANDSTWQGATVLEPVAASAAILRGGVA
jgi:hypothetical protein